MYWELKQLCKLGCCIDCNQLDNRHYTDNQQNSRHVLDCSWIRNLNLLSLINHKLWLIRLVLLTYSLSEHDSIHKTRSSSQIPSHCNFNLWSESGLLGTVEITIKRHYSSSLVFLKNLNIPSSPNPSYNKLYPPSKRSVSQATQN